MQTKKSRNIFLAKVAGAIPVIAAWFFPGQSAFAGDQTPLGIPNPLSTDSIPGFVSLLLGIVIQIGGIFSVFFLIYSGFEYVMASGNPEKVSSAHRTFLYTVIGIAILLGAAVLARVICGTIEQLGTFGPSLNCTAITAGV